MLEDLAGQKRFLLQTHGTPYRFAVLEEYECGHRLHMIAGGEFGITVDIHLYDVAVVAYFLFDLFEDG